MGAPSGAQTGRAKSWRNEQYGPCAHCNPVLFPPYDFCFCCHGVHFEFYDATEARSYVWAYPCICSATDYGVLCNVYRELI